VDGTPLQFTLRQMRTHFANPRVLAGLALAALVLGLSGPFGSFAAMPTFPRFAYWTAIVALTYGGGFLISVYIERRWAHGLPFWWRLLATALPPGVLATAIVLVLNYLTLNGPTAIGPEIGWLLFYCLLISLAIVGVTVLIGGAVREAVPAGAQMAQSPAAPPILDRVPLPQRGRLLALSVEDHYVDIITDRGKTLVLMRLADAIREAVGVEGLQIHRSHWVALDAVTKVHKAPGRLSLELSNGLKLPVSRGYQAAVRDAGLVK
jgi:hypothetical protein